MILPMHKGMSKKTIYQYFVDKDELVEAVLEADIHQMQTDCTTIAVDARNAVDEVFLSIDRVLEQFRNMNPMLIYDLEKFHVRGFRSSWSIRISSYYRLSVRILNGALQKAYTVKT